MSEFAEWTDTIDLMGNNHTNFLWDTYRYKLGNYAVMALVTFVFGLALRVLGCLLMYVMFVRSKR